MKNCSTSYVIRKTQMKKQGDTTMYLSDWPKSRIPTIPNTSEDVEQRELLTMLMGRQSGNLFLTK